MYGADEAIFAALDLGTNNCRMLIARPVPDGFRVVDAFSRVTRLGEGLAKTGRLSDPAMGRTVAALRACVDKMVRNRVTHVRLVATEACRRACNGGEFRRRVAEETGLTLDIITAEEEASLALAGCAPLIEGGQPWGLVFDIGGGSTEVMWVQCDAEEPPAMKVVDMLSLPLGVMTLADQAGRALLSRDGYLRTVNTLAKRLIPFGHRHSIPQHLARGEVQVLGTSGTVTTLAALHLGLKKYDRSKVDGLDLSSHAVEGVIEEICTMSASQRMSHPCIGADRADLVVAGCAILEAICHTWPSLSLRVADRGVREGILVDLMRKAGRMVVRRGRGVKTA